MTTETAWSTDNPATVAAYTQAQNDYRDAATRITRDAATLGNNNGVLISRGIFGSPDEVVGLEAEDPEHPPAGWIYMKGRDRLEPRRGKAGDVARAWLADHQPPTNDVRKVLAGHGLPLHARSDHSSGGYSLRAPMVFLHDGTLWAKYNGEISNSLTDTATPTWTPQPLSAYYAAMEAMNAAEQAAEKAEADANA